MVSPKTGEKSTHTLVIYYQSIKYNKRIQINHLYFIVFAFFYCSPYFWNQTVFGNEQMNAEPVILGSEHNSYKYVWSWEHDGENID